MSVSHSIFLSLENTSGNVLFLSSVIIETKDTTDGAAEGEEETEEVKEPPRPPDDDGRLLGITIHRSDRLKSDLYIAHPLVRVHLIDVETGTYVKKSVQ